MTDIFVNGKTSDGSGGFNYPGATYRSRDDFYSIFKPALINAGWVNHFESIPTTTDSRSNDFFSRFTATTENGHSCYLNLYQSNISSNVSSSHWSLTVTLSQNPDGINARGSSVMGNDNYDCHLWLAVNNLSLCYLNYDSSRTVSSLSSSAGISRPIGVSAAHFGWLNRASSDDAYAYMYGSFSTPISKVSAFFGKSHDTSIDWKRATDGYTLEVNNAALKNNELGSVQVPFPAQGISDRFTTTPLSLTRNNVPLSSTDYTAMGFHSGLAGQQNLAANNRVELGTYYFIESYNKYRGSVQFAATGMASLPPFATATLDNGRVYISAGDIGTQGFRIA